MKMNLSLRDIFAESHELKHEHQTNDADIPEMDMNRVKKLTLNKIQQDKKRKRTSFKSRTTRAACVFGAALLITTGSAYAFSEVGFQNIISQLTGVQQTKILMVGEAISNKDYELKVHEIVTDSYVGYVVVSIEALRDKSKENFNNYRIDLNHIGSGYSLGELDEYREPYMKYYKIGFSGATHKHSYNNGKLQFSVDGMKQAIEVSLVPTVERIDMDLPEDNSNGYQYKFHKLHLSELGLTLEGTDTRNMEYENLYRIELLFADGTKELLQKKMNEKDIRTHHLDSQENSSSKGMRMDYGSTSISENTATVSGQTIMDTSINGNLYSGGSSYHSGDDGNHLNISITFSKTIPLETLKQVMINDVAYELKR